IAPVRRGWFVLCPFGRHTRKQILQRPRHGPDYPSHHDQDRGQKSSNDQGGRNWVLGCQPGEEYGEGIFSRAEREIRNRLRRRGHRYAGRRLATVGRQGNRPARQRRQQLLLRRKLRRRAVGKQSRCWNPTKVWSAFQIKSKAGILSAKTSMANSTPEAAITHQLVSKCRPEGKSTRPAWASRPRVATVAYRLSPAAKL